MVSVGKDLNIWRELFNEFLKENEVYDKFQYNDTYLKNWTNNITYPEQFVAQPFEWGGTREGYQFWVKISKKWRSISKNNKVVKNTELARKMYPKSEVYNNYLLVKK